MGKQGTSGQFTWVRGSSSEGWQMRNLYLGGAEPVPNDPGREEGGLNGGRSRGRGGCPHWRLTDAEPEHQEGPQKKKNRVNTWATRINPRRKWGGSGDDQNGKGHPDQSG